MITVLLDNGHGVNTPGKCSPDKKLREYAYCREIVLRIHKQLTEKGIKSVILVPEDKDISLGERCRRANKYGKNSLFISVHNNAAGADGKWHNATGWTVWVAPKRSKNTDKFADILCKHAKSYKGNRAEMKHEANFYVIKNTSMPAVLTENLFLDNKEDVDFLLSEKGKEAITKIHVDSIIEYINSL